MVTLESADKALKSVYLGVVANQLNIGTNPLLAKIEQTTADVWGKEIRKIAPYGINGGIGAGTETGVLPASAPNYYVQFVSELKNLYGKIELSDKAIRASQNSAGAFVNLLNAEMEGLLKASRFNFSRMLYGNGSGMVAQITGSSASTKTIVVATTKNLIEGMVVDICNRTTGGKLAGGEAVRITYVNHSENKVHLNLSADFDFTTVSTAMGMYVQNSFNNEIHGLATLFSQTGDLYGVSRTEYPWLKAPIIDLSQTYEITDAIIQDAVDDIDRNAGSEVDFITCSVSVRRAYQEYLSYFRRNVDTLVLDGGFKALAFNGIPVYADRFADISTMYLLNTKDFSLHQLCDWKWLEGENGRVLKQNANTATYSATLVKYADLICNRPNGQAKIIGIPDSSTNPFQSVIDSNS